MEGVSRPNAVVLDDSAMIPTQNLIVPPPNRFTHEVTRTLPYYYGSVVQGSPPNGQFEPGTRVLLLVDNGARCRVADSQGLYVETDSQGLRAL